MSYKGVGRVETELSDDDEFTTSASGEIQDEDGESGMRIRGFFNLSISGTWEGLLTLQRSFDEGQIWKDIATYSNNEENYDQEIESNILYRIGFKEDDYDSGSAIVRLSK